MAAYPAAQRATPARPTLGDWGRFAAWAAAGAALALGSISWLGPGPIFGLAALVALIVLAATGRLRHPAFGLLAGCGAVALVIAWLNRKGPGTVYWHTATASGGDTYPDPRPWLVAGVALVAAGSLGFLLARGAHNHPPKAERQQ
jgi:hypothetical protein